VADVQGKHSGLQVRTAERIVTHRRGQNFRGTCLLAGGFDAGVCRDHFEPVARLA